MQELIISAFITIDLYCLLGKDVLPSEEEFTKQEKKDESHSQNA